MTTERPKILYHSFNQDLRYFLIGTKYGCRIYRIDLFRFGFELSIKGEFSMVKMLNSSNIFVIVGSPKNNHLTNKEVLVWDDKKKKNLSIFNKKRSIKS